MLCLDIREYAQHRDRYWQQCEREGEPFILVVQRGDATEVLVDMETAGRTFSQQERELIAASLSLLPKYLTTARHCGLGGAYMRCQENAHLSLVLGSICAVMDNGRK